MSCHATMLRKGCQLFTSQHGHLGGGDKGRIVQLKKNKIINKSDVTKGYREINSKNNIQNICSFIVIDIKD
jgi:hypothetical protein